MAKTSLTYLGLAKTVRRAMTVRRRGLTQNHFKRVDSRMPIKPKES
jgi:hypothetical protein